MTTVSSPVEVAPPPPPVPITSTGTGIANLPNQRHKIVAKNGANFTLMVCGKPSILENSKYTFVRNGLTKRFRLTTRNCRRVWRWQDNVRQYSVHIHYQGAQESEQKTFETTKQDSADPNHKSRQVWATSQEWWRICLSNQTSTELEEKMFKVKLTIIDTPGFGDYVNNRHSWIPIVDFIDDQHEKYMRQEQQPCREGLVDMRVHACLYFIKPTGHT